MRKHLENIVITSILDEDDFILTGTELVDPYQLVFITVDREGNIITKEDCGSDSKDYEGHYIVKKNDNYIIGGCSEGVAGLGGGEGWKAYVLEVDELGDEVKDKSIGINSNECCYAVKLIDDNIFLTGITKKEGKDSSVFLMKLDKEFDVRGMNTIGDFRGGMPADLSLNSKGISLICSLKDDDGYNVYRYDFDEDMEVMDKELITSGYALISEGGNDGVFLGGDEQGKQYLLELNKNNDIEFKKTYEDGRITQILVDEDNLLIGGFVKNNDTVHPSLFKTDTSGEIIQSKIWERDGLTENILKNEEGYLIDIHLYEDGEDTELLYERTLDNVLC